MNRSRCRPIPELRTGTGVGRAREGDCEYNLGENFHSYSRLKIERCVSVIRRGGRNPLDFLSDGAGSGTAGGLALRVGCHHLRCAVHRNPSRTPSTGTSVADEHVLTCQPSRLNLGGSDHTAFAATLFIRLQQFRRTGDRNERNPSRTGTGIADEHVATGEDSAIVGRFDRCRSRSRRRAIPILRAGAGKSGSAEGATEGGDEDEFCKSVHDVF